MVVPLTFRSTTSQSIHKLLMSNRLHQIKSNQYAYFLMVILQDPHPRLQNQIHPFPREIRQ